MKNSRSKREPKDKKKQQAIASGQAVGRRHDAHRAARASMRSRWSCRLPRLAPPVLQVIDGSFDTRRNSAHLHGHEFWHRPGLEDLCRRE